MVEFPIRPFCLRLVMWMGLLTMLISLPISQEEGPMTVEQLARKKFIATAVLFAGAGIAAAAAIGRYAIDHFRSDQRKRKPAVYRDL